MSTLRRILVTGATGKQGGALISALLGNPSSQPFHLVALTRNAKSAGAQALAKKTNVSVLEGDLDDVKAIFEKANQKFYGVFSVQTPLKPAVEEKQGKALVDAALANGVEHFIYASVERGGLEKSDADPTIIPHFISKFNIEQHLKEVTKGTNMKWSIIRPVFFMDNLNPGMFAKPIGSMWELNGMDSNLQMVSSKDIGIVAAEMFKQPEEFQSQSLSLATDELTPNEAHEVFKRVTGQGMPVTYGVFARVLKVALREQLGLMFDWFKTTGFGADVKAVKTRFPELQDLETWLRQSSGYRK